MAGRGVIPRRPGDGIHAEWRSPRVYTCGPMPLWRPPAYDHCVETAQNTSSSSPPQVGRGTRPGRESIAWFCAVMMMVLGALAAQQLRPRPQWVPNDRFDPITGTFLNVPGYHQVQYFSNGIERVLPGLLVLLVIPLLRRRPLAAAGFLTAGALGLGTEQTSGNVRYFYLIAVCAAIWYVAANRPRRISLTAAGVPCAGMAASMAAFPPGDSRLMLTHVFVVSLMVAVSWLAGDSIRTRRENALRLREETAAKAVTTERLRIARELHDMIAHSIGIIAIQAGVGSRVIDTQPDEARKALRAIEETSRDTLSGLRRTLTALRQTDTSAAPTDPAPGLADLGKLVATTRHAGVRIELTQRGMPRPLPSDIDLAAYRIVQESVTNVVRHSGSHTCRVIVSYADDDLSLEILDTGHGVFGSAGTGFGLVGMRERVSLLHGDFDAGPRPGGGFRVSARLPIPGFSTSYRTVKKSQAADAAAPTDTTETAAAK
jgi:signal transduction histidine kinase